MIDDIVVFKGLWNDQSEAITDVYLGSSFESNSFFNGIIRDLRFWNVKRTKADILNYKNNIINIQSGLL